MPNSQEDRPARIFVSYSRSDAAFVAPVVDLLRAVRNETFRDVDSIPAGEKWRPRIARAIARCDLFVVFWCTHAAGSAEVARECELAAEGGKPVIPALMDDTPISERIAEYQGVDLRRLVRHHPPAEGRGDWGIGIDFGTTNATIAYPIDAEAAAAAIRVAILDTLSRD